MADEILTCKKILDDNDAVFQWDFSYRVESGGASNNFCVTVLASEMEDADDAAEAKTKANVKAAVIKTEWLNAPVLTDEEVSANVGSVSL